VIAWSRDWRNDHPETAPPGDPSHIQSPNPDTIENANKCLLTESWYSCFLRGSTSAWQKQRWMLKASHWTEHRIPNGGARERTQGAEEVCSPIGGTIWTIQEPQSSQEINHQPKSTPRGTHSSSCIYSRAWPSHSPMGGEALCPVKPQCPSLGECQDQEAGVFVLVSRGRGGIGIFRGETRKGDNIWNVNKENNYLKTISPKFPKQTTDCANVPLHNNGAFPSSILNHRSEVNLLSINSVESSMNKQ
jgi:hypothetical protein